MAITKGLCVVDDIAVLRYSDWGSCCVMKFATLTCFKNFLLHELSSTAISGFFRQVAK
jgi:hypothetical protein